MKIGQAFPSKYLNADDFKGKGPVQFQIADVRIENVGTENKPQHKPCIYVQFQGRHVDKPIILNKTNAETISMDLGDETDNWRGHIVEVFLMMVQNPQGQTVPGIRLRVIHANAAPAAPFGATPVPAQAGFGQAPQQPGPFGPTPPLATPAAYGAKSPLDEDIPF